MKIYVGCALARASEEYRDFVASWKTLLAKEPDVEVLEFIGLVGGTPRDVYRHDLEQVQTCDAMIGFVDEPSLGLGMELREAIAHKKPLLCLHREGSVVTRMLIGASEAGDLSLAAYRDAASALEVTREFLTRN